MQTVAVPIPMFDEKGLLPAGVHDCAPAEIEARFGTFQGTERRPMLFAKLAAFLTEARAARIVAWVIVDGSFVTATARPNDIDLIVVVKREHDFEADLSPTAYNVISKRRVQRRFGFDLLVAREGSPELSQWVDFFAQVRLDPGRRKGILRLRL